MDEHTVSSAICSCLVLLLLSYHIDGRVSKCLAFIFIPIFSYLDFSHRQTFKATARNAQEHLHIHLGMRLYSIHAI
jgi:putative flippase GtrA